MKFSTVVSLLFFALTLNSYSQNKRLSKSDSAEVVRYNELGYSNRLIDPDQTIIYADKALKIAQKSNYLNGIAEAYRIKGIGKFYLDQSEEAIEDYLNALNYFRRSKNREGEAKVYSNIGNLYVDVDFDKSLDYFQKSLNIAQRLNIEPLLAGLYGNMGNIHQRKKNYNLALTDYQKSIALFTKLKNATGLTQNLQNIGVAYFNLNQVDKAKKYLLEAIKNAKQNDLNNTIARTNMTLALAYISQSQFTEAENAIREGITYAKIVKDPRLEYDYLYTSYELEYKRKNYAKALHYLKQVYTSDSVTYANNVSNKISLTEIQHRQQQKQLENERTIAEQKYTQTLFWASTIVAGLAFGVIFLLFRNVKKSARTNKQLVQLNEEVSRQKEDLNRINHSLEEIIDERTKDLKIKNKKLSEYSSHLSHQIRGPVATLKGLMILENDKLIEQEEFVMQLKKCVYDIDDKILNINEMLNNHEKHSLTEI